MNQIKGEKKIFKKLSSVQLLATGYFIVTLFFALLLTLPIASKTNKQQSFIDALFMSSSGISTTGLTVVDIGSFYSLFGQIILMLNFQIGGIGYMAFIVFIAYLLEIKLSVKNQIVASESVAGAYPGFSYRFFNTVITFTFIFEIIGGIILFFYWLQIYPLPTAMYFGIFHSVSAFCTAGFCLFPESLMSYKNSITVNLVINILSLIGGIGFFVLNEIYMITKKAIRKERYKRMSTHSLLAIAVTIIVIVTGAAIIFISEKWPSSAGIKERILASSFQAISASTTDGFNSIDIGAMSSTSLFMIILLMFIGASPGSTGGGIKTTTLGVIFVTIWSKLKGKEDSNLFKRRISDDIKDKASLIFFLMIFAAILDLLVLTATEKFSFLQILFEIISALGNTGLSTGITSNLSNLSKILLSITMFIGRVGPLTIGLALVERTKPSFRYPDGDIFVG
ncbi:MAG: potassium transporter TrkG [Nitrospinota bacterium]